MMRARKLPIVRARGGEDDSEGKGELEGEDEGKGLLMDLVWYGLARVGTGWCGLTGERRLQAGLLEEVIQHDRRHCVTLQLDHLRLLGHWVIRLLGD